MIWKRFCRKAELNVGSCCVLFLAIRKVFSLTINVKESNKVLLWKWLQLYWEHKNVSIRYWIWWMKEQILFQGRCFIIIIFLDYHFNKNLLTYNINQCMDKRRDVCWNHIGTCTDTVNADYQHLLAITRAPDQVQTR